MTDQSADNDSGPKGAFVSSYLLYLLAASSEAASTQFHRHVRDEGLRVPEWRVLACLHDQDGLMITRLAQYALIEQSRLTRIVDQMAGRGLLVRKADVNDRRRIKVFLTEKGRKLSSRLGADARRHEKQLLDILEGTDAARIKHALQDLLKCLKGPSYDAK